MKRQNWTCWAVATALFFGGVLLGCGTNDRPAQKKQDGLPTIVTDKIPEEPDAVQSQDAGQDSDAVQDSDEDSAEAKFLRDAIYEE